MLHPMPVRGPSTQARYRRPVSRLWWVRRRSYTLFVLRELSSVFVAWFVVYLLLLVDAVHQGSDSYRQFLVLHAVTWFNLAPRAIVIRLQGRRLPSRIIAAGHFAAWAVVSAAVAWIAFRGL